MSMQSNIGVSVELEVLMSFDRKNKEKGHSKPVRLKLLLQRMKSTKKTADAGWL